MKRMLILLAVAVPVAALAYDWCQNQSFTLTAMTGSATTVPSNGGSHARITVCNSNENSGSNVVKCRNDGVAPVAYTSGTILSTHGGDVISKGSCVTYNNTSTVLCTGTSATLVTGYECSP